MPTRLEKTLYRLQAQHACFAWAFEQIAGRPGIVFELGLGLGRTYNHMHHHIPDRRIVAFDRKVGSYPDCTPDEKDIVLGELADTLPRAAEQYLGQVILAHTDIGSFDRQQNRLLSELMSANLSPALAPGALVMSDLPLALPESEQLPLPEGARADCYYLYRRV
jgi:hypothetical protein